MERANFTALLYLLVPVTLFIASHTPKRWRFLFAVLQLVLYIAIISVIPPGSDPSSDYVFGTTFFSVLSALNYFVLSDPYEEHWQLSPVQTGNPKSATGKSTEKSIQEDPVKYKDLGLRSSLLWCFRNGIDIRGIGWNWRIPHLPPGPTKGISRASYLVQLVTSLTKLYLLYDFSITVLRRVTRDGQVPLYSVEVFPRAVAVVSFAITNITLMEIGFTIICLIGAATGLFWPRFEDNHPLIGYVSDGYTISRFWGRVWHQNMRRILQAPGKYLAHKILNVKRGSLSSRYVQSYTAFFLSGFYHYIGAQTSLPLEQFYGTWRFFLLQPNLMLVEDFMIWLGTQKLGFTSQKWRYLGYIWTYVVLTLTATGFVDECVRLQLVPATSAFPFSLAGTLIST